MMSVNAGETVAAGPQEERAAACANCGAALGGRYCSECGQKAGVHRSLAAFGGDLAASLYNFDSKFWRTLPMLVWQPGELTRRYVDGQRVRFISPIALYLFTVFLMFAMLNFSGATQAVDLSREMSISTEREAQALAQLEAERRRVEARGGDVTNLDMRITKARSDLKDLREIQAGRVPVTFEGEESGPKWLRDAVARAVADPKLAVAKIQEAASKYSWLLIPLSVPVLRLLFPLRRRHLFAHTVFVTYSLSFMMLLVIAAGLLTTIGASALASWLALVPPLHIYRQLRGAYRIGRISALVRTLLLLIAAIAVMVLWVLAIVALGLFN